MNVPLDLVLLKTCPGISAARSQYLAPSLGAAMLEYQVNTPQRVAAFLAQFAHETAGFSTFEENLSYTAERLCVVWPRRFKTIAAARPYERNPEALANLVYANRMGNGSPQSGDGWRFRGRGLCHLTGKDNYVAASPAIGVNLVAEPELAAKRPHAYRLGGWFWKSRGCNELADVGRFNDLTRRINGGLNGLAERLAYWERARLALGVA